MTHALFNRTASLNGPGWQKRWGLFSKCKMEKSQGVVPCFLIFGRRDAGTDTRTLQGALSLRRLYFVPTGYEAPARMTRGEMQCDSSSSSYGEQGRCCVWWQWWWCVFIWGIQSIIWNEYLLVEIATKQQTPGLKNEANAVPKNAVPLCSSRGSKR